MPTVIVLALIAGAGVLAYQVSSGSVGREAPPEVKEAVTQDGYSRYSDDGIAYITDSLQARVDLSEPSPDARRLGLPADGDTLVTADNFTVSVGLYVGEEEIRIPASSMTLTTKDGVLVGLSLVSAASSYQEQRALLDTVAERFGIDTAAMATLDADVAENVRAEKSTSYAFGPGTAFGRPTTATVAVYGAGGTGLTIDVDFSS